MASWGDVTDIAAALPLAATRAGEARTWRVKDVLFVWERPLRASDHKALGSAAPAGEILAARVPDEGAKHALVASGRPYFTTPHFDGYPIVLVELDLVGRDELEELITEAWLSRAPKRVAAEWLAQRG